MSASNSSIKVIHDDILTRIDEGVPTFILHGCNCFNVMGAGVAKYLADMYTDVRRVDNLTVKGDKTKMGSFTEANVKDNLTIFNCYTQYRYGRGKNFKPEALALCLVGIKAELERRYVYLNYIDIRSVKIGCGYGGSNWAKVKHIYETLFNEIVIYDGKRL